MFFEMVRTCFCNTPGDCLLLGSLTVTDGFEGRVFTLLKEGRLACRGTSKRMLCRSSGLHIALFRHYTTPS